MKQCFLALISLIFFSIKLISSDINDQIIRLNIGGYKTEFTRQTIENFGGPVLNRLINGSFGVILDKYEYIFIDWPQKGAKLVDYFIRTQKLPKDYDEGVARDAAEYFGIEPMLKYIYEHEKLSEITKYHFCEQRLVTKCKLCAQEMIHLLDNILNHLKEEHQARIKNIETTSNGIWTFHDIYYRLPIQ